ncbi:hypothetical protein FACS189494_04610 [Spirochaetia bacterium]|nr:hypothetical protein FACS189494_04610 [Spirochaetia bacterium]
MFHTSIQMDTAYFTGGGRNSYNWPTVGRFGLVALQKLWSIKEFNPYTAAFAALLFLELSAIAWCYLIELFSKQDKRNYKLIPFAVLYMSMPMWIEHFIGLLQAAEVSFIVFLCPVIIFLFYKGIFDNEKIKILIACALLFFIASVYQGILPMFLCGVFICFILFQDNSNYEKALYRNVAIKLFVFVVVSVGLYFFVNKFCFLNSDYLDNMNSWGKQSFKQNVLTIFNIAIDIFKISDPHNIYGSIILLPATVLFIIKITCNAIKNKQKDRLLYILAGLCIPLCILLLTISGANKPPLRSMYVLPLATAFMPYYLLTKYKPAYVKLLAALMLVVVVFQIQVSVQIQYSDYLRYINDIHIAYDLDRMIRDEQDDTNSLPIAIIPQENTRTTLNFNTNYLRGEISGTPFLQWLSFLRLGFMQTFGINYAVANEAQTAEARIYAENMSAYPDKGCVKRYNGIIVIKLSE